MRPATVGLREHGYDAVPQGSDEHETMHGLDDRQREGKGIDCRSATEEPGDGRLLSGSGESSGGSDGEVEQKLTKLLGEDNLVGSSGEFGLLRAFVEHPRRVLSRDQLLDYASGQDSELYDRAIDVQVSRLRRKLAAHDGGADLIRTVRSEGYMFVAPVTRG